MTIKIFNITIILFAIISATISSYTSLVKASAVEDVCAIGNNTTLCENFKGSNVPGNDENPVINVITIVINVLSWLVGVLAVIYVIWGGFKYIKSGGESGSVAEAKKMIIYALVGLVLAVVAPQLIRFALDKLV